MKENIIQFFKEMSKMKNKNYLPEDGVEVIIETKNGKKFKGFYCEELGRFLSDDEEDLYYLSEIANWSEI
jgi:hypothetical protein